MGWWPAPVITRARASGSASRVANNLDNSPHILKLMALRCSGRLVVMVAVGGWHCTRMSPLMAT